MNTATMTRFFLRPAAWDSFAEETAKRIPHDNPSDHVTHLCKLVESGAAELLQVAKDGKPVGLVVFAIEGDAKREMNIIAAFSEATRDDLTAELLPELERFAAMDRGCVSVRFHTVRAGLVVKTIGQGYRVSEVVMRKYV